MNPKTSSFRALLLLIGSSALTLLSANAQLTWDANGTGSGRTNGGGAWLGTNLWWNGATNQNWVSGSNAIFGGPNTAGGAVTLASPTAVGSITFNTFTGTYTLGSAGQAHHAQRRPHHQRHRGSGFPHQSARSPSAQHRHGPTTPPTPCSPEAAWNHRRPHSHHRRHGRSLLRLRPANIITGAVA